MERPTDTSDQEGFLVAGLIPQRASDRSEIHRESS